MAENTDVDVKCILEALKMTFPFAGYWCMAAGKGGCYRLYLLLHTIFPTAEAWSNGVHVISRINGLFYDITGPVDPRGYSPIDPDEQQRYELLIVGADYHWI